MSTTDQAAAKVVTGDQGRFLCAADQLSLVSLQGRNAIQLGAIVPEKAVLLLAELWALSMGDQR